MDYLPCEFEVDEFLGFNSTNLIAIRGWWDAFTPAFFDLEFFSLKFQMYRVLRWSSVSSACKKRSIFSSSQIFFLSSSCSYHSLIGFQIYFSSNLLVFMRLMSVNPLRILCSWTSVHNMETYAFEQCFPDFYYRQNIIGVRIVLQGIWCCLSIVTFALYMINLFYLLLPFLWTINSQLML